MGSERLNILLNTNSDIWNEWRKENLGDEIPDLSHALLTNMYADNIDLSNANLFDAIMMGAIFRNANFMGSDLTAAHMNGATFIKSNFRNANFQYAEIQHANLEMADLTNANLENADLRGANLQYANLNEANLKNAKLGDANLFSANLIDADLEGADLSGAFLKAAFASGANFSNSVMVNSNLTSAMLDEANLRGADLRASLAIDTRLRGADLSNSKIYGISAWDAWLDDAIQQNLIITDNDEPLITVDNLEVAQFIHLMLRASKVRDVLETITSKAVLILGRFSEPKLKQTIDAIRNSLRSLNYVPIVFDFERITGQNYTETIKVLAGISKFVIADLSSPRSIQQELQAIIPDFELPIVPIIDKNTEIWAMFESHQAQDHVLPIYQYRNLDELSDNFETTVVNRAENLHKRILIRKAKYEIQKFDLNEIKNQEEKD